MILKLFGKTPFHWFSVGKLGCWADLCWHKWSYDDDQFWLLSRTKNHGLYLIKSHILMKKTQSPIYSRRGNDLNKEPGNNRQSWDLNLAILPRGYLLPLVRNRWGSVALGCGLSWRWGWWAHAWLSLSNNQALASPNQIHQGRVEYSLWKSGRKGTILSGC